MLYLLCCCENFPGSAKGVVTPPKVKCGGEGDKGRKLTKEEVREMEGETDKDVDSSQQVDHLFLNTRLDAIMGLNI